MTEIKDKVIFEEFASGEIDKTKIFRSFHYVFDGVRTKSLLVQFKKVLEILHLATGFEKQVSDREDRNADYCDLIEKIEDKCINYDETRA